jgi:hypothetical protein
MRTVNAHIHWTGNLDRLLAAFLRQPLAQEIEIGVGAVVWAGIVFVVVHFGGLMAA